MRTRTRKQIRPPGCPVARQPKHLRPALERLECRSLLSVTFSQQNLISDVPGLAQSSNPNLVNAWGMALGLNSALWVAENHNGTAESFDGTGQQVPASSPLTVTIPAPGGTGT